MLKTLLRRPAFKGNPTVRLRSNAFRRIIKIITWIFSIQDPKQYWVLLDRILLLMEKSGPTFTVQYLKEATRVTQKFIAGQPCVASEGLSLSIVNSLPHLIPGGLRKLIRSGDQVTIRAVLTVLTLYKILKCRPKLKINSITDPFTGISSTLNPLVLRKIIPLLPKVARRDVRSLVSVSAGPNARKAFMGLPFDALALSRSPRILHSLGVLAEYFGGSLLYTVLKAEILVVNNLFTSRDPILAKLSFLKEPAGKVRVVAIIDGWSQIFLTGLHDTLQAILEKIPQDGTMDQAAPINRLPRCTGPVYSFDLSSATDRLPISLQAQVLSLLFSEKVGQAWREVLVGREYRMNAPEFRMFGNIRYAVGQPMGALSSFNMLAITHHIIVQVAAFNCGYRTWFENYALLGDDIVICDREVANAYRTIMLDLGLELSPSKGLESPLGVFEFCKRLIGPFAEYSPLGMKGMAVVLRSPAYLTSLFVDLLGKGHTWTANDVLELFRSPPSFVIKSKKVRDRVLWTLLGIFGIMRDTIQIGPGKTLDSSVDKDSALDLLILLRETSRLLAKKKDAAFRKASKDFLVKFRNEFSVEAVRDFHRWHFLLYVPSSLKGTVNSLVKLWHGPGVAIAPVWSEFPSWHMILEHIREVNFRTTLQNTKFTNKGLHPGLVDERIMAFRIEDELKWNTQEELLEALYKAAEGWHTVTSDLADFLVDSKPPELRAGESIMKFWETFEALSQRPPYVGSKFSDCLLKLDVPFFYETKKAHKETKRKRFHSDKPIIG